jgi:hypothetical protein
VETRVWSPDGYSVVKSRRNENVTTLGVKRDYAVCAGHEISSEVHLETTSGLLVGHTQTRSTAVWNSFQSGVQALVLGTGGVVLAAGPLNTFDIGDSRIRHRERTDVWVWHVPPGVADQAKETALVHTWNPRWLSNLRLTLGTVDAIADLLGHSEMGDLTVGGEIAWPQVEMPWARWPDGHVRSGADDEEIIRLPRPLRVGDARVETRA